MTPFKLQSMTGFGRAQADTPLGQFSVELRTVNNRFQDISVALPRELGLFEAQLRGLLKQEIPRGKIDCRIRYTPAPEQQPQVTVNIGLARDYVLKLKQLQDLGVGGELPVEVLITLPGVVEIRPAELDEQALWETLQGVVKQGMDRLRQERLREGAALGAQLQELTDQLRALLEEVEARKEEIVQRYRERLAARIAELEAEIKTHVDTGRLEMEVALFVDRGDISEEIVRLNAHLVRLEQLLTGDENTPAGKNLDFLVQELGREVNTIGSKVRDTSVVGQTLEMKSIIERIREQAQNIQ